jgi:hypothetical protein
MKKNPITLSLLLGLPFILLFLFIRNLPVEPCEFLHEETYNEEGELDYCGSDETGFVDLSIRKWPMKIDFRPVKPVVVNQLAQFEIKIDKADGSPLTSSDVALSHTQKIHLLAVDESLNDYHHIHPVADSLFDGVWHFSLTPQLAGKYSVYLDFIPLKSPRRVLLSSSFTVKGKRDSIQARQENLKFSYEDINFELIRDLQESTDDKKIITLKAVDKRGNDVTFYPVMGAFAHMVAFDSELNGFAHLHPISEDVPSSENRTHAGPLSFGFTAPKYGIYRLWAQVKTTTDKEIFIPFDLEFGT